MTALTQNTPLSRGFGDTQAYPVKAATTIYEGALVIMDISGNALPAAAGGGVFIGTASAKANNSTGVAGAINVDVYSGQYQELRTLTGVAKADVGRPVYASDDATLTFDPTGTSAANIAVGFVQAYTTTNTAWVLMDTTLGTKLAPVGNKVVFFDDFLGNATIADSSIWKTVDVGDATEAIVAATHLGEFALTIAATSEAEDAVLYFGDSLNFDIDKLETFECRAKVVTPGAGVAVVLGMASAHNLDKDTVAEAAWFKCDANLACKCETDDGTNNEDDKTADTLVTATYYDFLIDFRDTADVKFYLNGVAVATGTTFDMSNFTTGLQPYFSVDKPSGATTGSLTIDYVRIVSQR